MAELTINWETLSRVSPEVKEKKVVTGEEATAPEENAEPAAPTTSDKPFFIYVSDPTATTGFDTVEKVVLDDDRVKLGSHAFHPVKMTDDVAKSDPLLAEKGGKAVPRIIFVTADFKTVKPLEGGSLKLGEVWGSMKATANKCYVQDLDGLVRDLKTVLNDFDKINNERKVLDEKEARAKDKALSESDKKDIAAKRADIDKREKAAIAKKDKLWTLKAKEAKAA